MKKLFTAIAVCGFILALGTAGTSDLEAGTGLQLITQAELYSRCAIALVMLVSGSIGSKLWQTISTHKATIHGNTEGIQATQPTQCINNKT